MAPSIHDTGVPLPKPPPNAHAVRAKPDISGIMFHMVSAAVMVNGFMALVQLGMTEWINEQVSRGSRTAGSAQKLMLRVILCFSKVGGKYILDTSRFKESHFQFLTIDGLWLTVITCLLGGLGELLPGVSNQVCYKLKNAGFAPLSALRTIKRAFLLIALPVELTISTIYWGLIVFAPTLIVPDMASFSNDTSGPVTSSSEAPQLLRIPTWIDVSIHGVPAIVLVIDFFFREKKYRPPVSTLGAIILSIIAGSAYSVWVEHCATYNDRFPYPFLPSDSFPGRIAIYAGGTFFAYVAFKIINGLHA
ncbi:hypothetical protein QFC19_008659 [Naganishia cerealis]|uniref:Uncharacterized protein n=1 Tax=Naganishia cerealis TaxID=610337 RepID=A0ACC2V1T0_9TREE|nr:hypothetical protein QFC19_008659 [Naganishia cerealis]